MFTHFSSVLRLVRTYYHFTTPQRVPYRFREILFGVVCFAEHRDDGVPFQCVLLGLSFCVHVSFLDVIGFSIWMKLVCNSFDHCLLPVFSRLSIQNLVRTGATSGSSQPFFW